MLIWANGRANVGRFEKVQVDNKNGFERWESNQIESNKKNKNE